MNPQTFEATPSFLPSTVIQSPLLSRTLDAQFLSNSSLCGGHISPGHKHHVLGGIKSIVMLPH